MTPEQQSALALQAIGDLYLQKLALELVAQKQAAEIAELKKAAEQAEKAD